MDSYGISMRPRQGQLLAHRGASALVTDLNAAIEGPQAGYYREEARLLSGAIITVDSKRPRIFSAARAGAHGILADGQSIDDRDLLEDALFLAVAWTLEEETLELELRLTNHAPHRVRNFELALEFQADFADYQEVLDGRRQQEAAVQSTWHVERNELRLSYLHPELPLATIVRVAEAGAPIRWDAGRLVANGALAPQRDLAWTFRIAREPVQLPGRMVTVDGVPAPPAVPEITTTNPTVALAWQTAVRDLQVLPLGLKTGPYAIAAGVPLYLHFFGRDTLTAGWQALLAAPEFLRDALRLNASLQGTNIDDWFDEQPGKMIHEVRSAPLSLLGIDPLLRSYGDYATPPDFVVMLAQYYAWTADRETTRALLPAAWRALDWLERFGDLDQDGFIEYVTRSPKGVKNQGWKDAPESIVDDDGNVPENPLATSELQGYWYAALRHGAMLAGGLANDYGLAIRLRNRANRLKKEFNERFWLESEGHYALALDAQKRPIRAAGSNDAHLLITGIVPRERAIRLVERLFQPDIFTGWGIRTLSSDHPAYNPFSYHRGSVWPVEHGTFALGLARYGFWDELAQLAKAVFDSTELFEEHRLPEVVGGLQRNGRAHPGIYPQACSPQAWTASTIVMIIQALLGVNPVAPLGVAFMDPHLPPWLPDLRLSGVRIGRSVFDITATRTSDGTTSFRAERRHGRIRVLRQPPPQDITTTIGQRLKGLVLR